MNPTSDIPTTPIPAPLADRLEAGDPVALLSEDGLIGLASFPGFEDLLWQLGFASIEEALPFVDALLQGFGYRRFVASNDVLCRVCGQVVSSSHADGDRRCGCRNVMVGGGHERIRRRFASDQYDDLAVFGWALEGERSRIVAELTARRRTPQAVQLALAERRGRVGRYEIVGIKPDGREAVVEIAEGFAPFTAAASARCVREGMRVVGIRRLPGDGGAGQLAGILGSGGLVLEARLEDAVEEWCEATGNLACLFEGREELFRLAEFLKTRIDLLVVPSEEDEPH